MKMPKLLGRRNPVADALDQVQRIEAQRRKLDDRLAAAVERVEFAQAARRAALLDGDPDADSMAKLDRACVEAAEARAGIDEAMRHIAVQLEDAQRAYQALVDAANRAKVIAECEARADRIDAAAAVLREAAERMGEARVRFVEAIAADGVAGPDWQSPYSAALLAAPVIEQAIRTATNVTIGQAIYGGLTPSNDVLIEARRAQSGVLRDRADEMRDGAPVIEPPRPAAAPIPVIRSPKTTVRLILARGIEYDDGDDGFGFGMTGGNDLPPAVAEAAKRAGIGFDPDSHTAKVILAAMARLPINTPLCLANDGRTWIADPGEVPEGSRTGKRVTPPMWLHLDVGAAA